MKILTPEKIEFDPDTWYNVSKVKVRNLYIPGTFEIGHEFGIVERFVAPVIVNKYLQLEFDLNCADYCFYYNSVPRLNFYEDLKDKYPNFVFPNDWVNAHMMPKEFERASIIITDRKPFKDVFIYTFKFNRLK